MSDTWINAGPTITAACCDADKRTKQPVWADGACDVVPSDRGNRWPSIRTDSKLLNCDECGWQHNPDREHCYWCGRAVLFPHPHRGGDAA